MEKLLKLMILCRKESKLERSIAVSQILTNCGKISFERRMELTYQVQTDRKMLEAVQNEIADLIR